MKYIHKAMIIIAACAMLTGCGETQRGTSVSGSTMVQAEIGKEIKISANGKVCAGDQILSEGGKGSLVTGCDITVKSDGTIVISTEKGEYTVCRNYLLTIPARTAEVLQVSIPLGPTLVVNSNGFLAGQVVVTDTGMVETSLGTITKQDGKVVFTTKDGEYTIQPAAKEHQQTNTQVAACLVKTPSGETVQVREPLAILGNQATVHPDGSVETAEGKISMLQETPSIVAKEGVYTFFRREVVIAAEYTKMLPAVVIDPEGNLVVIDGKVVIEKDNIVVHEDGSLVTRSGTISVKGGRVTVKPLAAQGKAMILPNGDIVDITDAQILEDGTVFFPEVENDGEISGERYYSSDGFLTIRNYYQSTGIQNYHAVLKGDPTATHVETLRYDLHYLHQPMLEMKMTELDTGDVDYVYTAVLDTKGTVLKSEYQSETDHRMYRKDIFGRTIYEAIFNAWGNISLACENTYLTENAYDERHAMQTIYNSSGQKQSVSQYDENGKVVYTAYYFEGRESCFDYYENGKIVCRMSTWYNGDRVIEVFNADGSSTQTVYKADDTRKE